MSKKSRREVVVNPKKFATYALAGAAAAVGAETVDADITFVDIADVAVNSTSTSSGATYQLYFGDASSFHLDFYHHLISPGSGSAAAGGQVFSTNTSGVSVAGFTNGGFDYLSNVVSGAAISTLTNWLPSSGYFAYGSGGGSSQFQGYGYGFLAVRWDNDGGGSNDFSYGWVRVGVGGTPLNDLGIFSYAFADPGEALNVGQTAVPEPGSLACLALGAVGLISWRRRRKAV